MWRQLEPILTEDEFNDLAWREASRGEFAHGHRESELHGRDAQADGAAGRAMAEHGAFAAVAVDALADLESSSPAHAAFATAERLA